MPTSPRISVWMVIAAATIGGCSSSSPPAAGTVGTPATIKESDWKMFQPAGTALRVLMPGTPSELAADADSAIHGVMLPGEVEYTVAWSDHAEEVARIGADAALEAARDAQTLLGDRELLEDTALEVQGHPARDVVSVDADHFVLHCRMVMVQDRLYQLSWMTPEAGYSATDANLQRFLDSIEVVQ